ncbi:MAG: hypothetical protein ACOVQ6_11460 [Brevundimonas sp.]
MKRVWTILMRFWTGTPPANEAEWAEDRKALAIMSVLSSACLMIALVIWMTWVAPAPWPLPSR